MGTEDAGPATLAADWHRVARHARSLNGGTDRLLIAAEALDLVSRSHPGISGGQAAEVIRVNIAAALAGEDREIVSAQTAAAGEDGGP